MSEQVVFSQLSRKFIDENMTPAAGAAGCLLQPVIGHHRGYRLSGGRAHLPMG